MVNLTRASQELFRRTPDECFESLDTMLAHCRNQQEASMERWHPPADFAATVDAGCLSLKLGTDGASLMMNDWSFGQLCKLAGVAKETVNRLSPGTARQVLCETLPGGNKPLQLFTQGQFLRSLHGSSYTRLYNADLVESLRAFEDFRPPEKGFNGATGLYAGEQDLFCFLIDPVGWIEIEGEAFAPGFFVWNSEVGRRSFGIQTFWFQAVCQNHIVWDAVEVVEYTRKHTASVADSLKEMCSLIEGLVRKRDERKDAFANVIARAMQTKLGDDADEVVKQLASHGISRGQARQALEFAERRGRFTLFAIVDGLTRLAGEIRNAGERLDADQKAGALLALAA